MIQALTKCNATQHFGYALRGYSPRLFKFFSRGKRLSAIAALTIFQLLYYELHEQNVDGNNQRTLLPHCCLLMDTIQTWWS